MGRLSGSSRKFCTSFIETDFGSSQSVFSGTALPPETLSVLTAVYGPLTTDFLRLRPPASSHTSHQETSKPRLRLLTRGQTVFPASWSRLQVPPNDAWLPLQRLYESSDR